MSNVVDTIVNDFNVGFQKLKYARKLLKNVEINDDLNNSCVLAVNSVS